MKKFRVRRIFTDKANRFLDYGAPNDGNFIPMDLAVVTRSLILAFGILFFFGIPLIAQTAAPGPNSEETTEPEGEKTIDPELASAQDALNAFLKGIDAAQGSEDEQQWEKVYKRLEIAFPTRALHLSGDFLRDDSSKTI